MTNNELIAKGEEWFQSKGWSTFPFQQQAWAAYLQGFHGLVNAPTGSGKTYSLVVPTLLEFIKEGNSSKNSNGLRVIWITPIRALAKEIANSTQKALQGLGVDWQVGIRTGDTTT
uniref:DEAD/DEAH box helicase n=1 Tax=Fulvivirga sp. TaxID=1931237 RepID=UPI00404931C2